MWNMSGEILTDRVWCVSEDGTNYQDLLHEMTGQKTVPSVFINKKHIGGCDNTMKVLSFLPDLGMRKTLILAESHWPDFGMNVMNPSHYENTQTTSVEQLYRKDVWLWSWVMLKHLFTVPLISIVVCSANDVCCCGTGTQRWRPAEAVGWRQRGVWIWSHRHWRWFWRSGLLKGELNYSEILHL